MTGAVDAAIDFVALLNTVADDPTLAMGALGRQGVDGAFEGIEGVTAPGCRDDKGLVVIVSAHFT